MANMNATETRLTKEAQKALGAAKADMRDAMKSTRGMMQILEAAGATKEYAAAYRVWVEMDAALNAIHRAHATATDAMAATYDDGGIVVFGGGGGR